MTEVTDYFFRFRFQYCPPCDATTFKQSMPRFYLTANGADAYYTTAISSITLGGRTCSGFSHAGAATTQSAKIWVDFSTNTVCRHEWGNGKTIDFIATSSNVNAAQIADDAIMRYDGSNFRPNAVWADQCQAPSCKVKLDVMVVLDESGSIDGPEWVQATTFVYNFFNAFTVGPDDVLGAVTKFAWSSELTIPLNSNKADLLQKISNLNQAQGATCIGCGIATGAGELSANGRPTANNVMVVITDGYNNQQTSSFPSVVAAAKAVPIEIFGIGVGGGFLDSTIESFVSDPIADHKFIVNDYAGLSTVLNSVVTATCQEVPGTLCGAGCAGLCACGSICTCPSTCDDFNQCTDELCTPGQNGNGCVYTQKDCNPNADVCNIYTCDPQTGCTSVPLDCDDGNPCTDDLCGDPTNPANPNRIQCTYRPRDCADTSICTVDTCDSSITSGDPCVHTAALDCAKCQDFQTSGDIDCSLPRFNPRAAQFTACNPFVCDPNSLNSRYDLNDPIAPNNDDGPCVSKPVLCDDSNPCTNEACDAGNCIYTSFVTCNDANACTQDACDPKSTAADPCVYTTIDVNILCADGDPCTDETCDPTTGCGHVPTVCPNVNECIDAQCIATQGGCVYANRTCAASDACHLGACVPKNQGLPFTEAEFCVDNEIPGTINSCGVCLGNDVSCFLEGSKVTVYAITGGVIAAIVIAVIVALALGVFGGKKGYDYFQARKNANQNWSQNNQIYQDMPSGSNAAAT
eukprot:TRINITY_DN1244_c0_g1_i1.p1 TRINITY_DN1244_c0_g1~~TRINITY_DN1244_c0_g1_i1.p1  ORF type:complete len:837 (-),score=284.35 TRINITY_DN1244_c0_g1_i1:132-2369(-)